MDLIRIYQCLCDRTRLRMLICCCTDLCACATSRSVGRTAGESVQALAYLNPMVWSRQSARQLAHLQPRGEANTCSKGKSRLLQDCASEDKIFQRDTEKLNRLLKNLDADSPLCCTTANL